MSRKINGKSNPSGRDSGRFIALPHSVVDCAAYLHLSMHARALLIEIAKQFNSSNNGKLLVTKAVMKKRGWNSSSMLAKAKKELLDNNFIFETFKGHRPNKASWYAVTWYRLDANKGFDEGAYLLFKQGAYHTEPLIKNKMPSPPSGPKDALIGPPQGYQADYAGLH